LINNKEIIDLIINHNNNYLSWAISLKEINKKYKIPQKELFLFNYNLIDIKTIKYILDNTDKYWKKAILSSDIIDKTKKEILLKEYPEIQNILNIKVNDEKVNIELEKLYENNDNINYDLLDAFLSKQPSDIIYSLIELPIKNNTKLLEKLPISRNKLFKNNDIVIKLININIDFFYMQEKKDKSNIISNTDLDIYKNMEIFTILNNNKNLIQIKKIFFYPKMQAKFKSLIHWIKDKNIILTPDMNNFINKIISMINWYSKQFNAFNTGIEKKVKKIKKETSWNQEILDKIWKDNNFMNKILNLSPEKTRNIAWLINSSITEGFWNPKYYINELFRLYENKDEVIKILDTIEKEINKKRNELIDEFDINNLSKNQINFLEKKWLIIEKKEEWKIIKKIDPKKLDLYHLNKIEQLEKMFKQYNIKYTPEILNKIFIYELLNWKEIKITSKKQLEEIIKKSNEFKPNKNNQKLYEIAKAGIIANNIYNTEQTISQMK